MAILLTGCASVRSGVDATVDTITWIGRGITVIGGAVRETGKWAAYQLSSDEYQLNREDDRQINAFASDVIKFPDIQVGTIRSWPGDDSREIVVCKLVERGSDRLVFNLTLRRVKGSPLKDPQATVYFSLGKNSSSS